MRSKQGFSKTYTPDKTVDAEERIRWHLRASRVECFPEKVPIHLTVTFHCPRPKSAKKGSAFPTTRPDLDQYIKLLLDAGNGLLWADDSQVAIITASKVYAELDPEIKLTLEELK